MIAELGQLALILALCLAIVQSVVPLVGAAKDNADWMALARPPPPGVNSYSSPAPSPASRFCS